MPTLCARGRRAQLTWIKARSDWLGGQQGVGRQRHDLGGGDHVVDADVLVGLVGQVEDAGAVGDAVAQAADTVDVLLV